MSSRCPRERAYHDERSESLRAGFRPAFRRFLRDLPLLLGTWAIFAIGVLVWMLANGEPLGGAAIVAAAVFLTVIPVGPAAWLRNSDPGVPWVIAMGWCLLWLGVVFAVLAMSGALGS